VGSFSSPAQTVTHSANTRLVVTPESGRAEHRAHPLRQSVVERDGALHPRRKPRSAVRS
jgi:hypothetical protein